MVIGRFFETSIWNMRLKSKKDTTDTIEYTWHVDSLDSRTEKIGSCRFLGGPISNHIWQFEFVPSSVKDVGTSSSIGREDSNPNVLLYLLEKGKYSSTTDIYARVDCAISICSDEATREIFRQSSKVKFLHQNQYIKWSLNKKDILRNNETRERALKVVCKIALMNKPDIIKPSKIPRKSKMLTKYKDNYFPVENYMQNMYLNRIEPVHHSVQFVQCGSYRYLLKTKGKIKRTSQYTDDERDARNAIKMGRTKGKTLFLATVDFLYENKNLVHLDHTILLLFNLPSKSLTVFDSGEKKNGYYNKAIRTHVRPLFKTIFKIDFEPCRIETGANLAHSCCLQATKCAEKIMRDGLDNDLKMLELYKNGRPKTLTFSAGELLRLGYTLMSYKIEDIDENESQRGNSKVFVLPSIKTDHNDQGHNAIYDFLYATQINTCSSEQAAWIWDSVIDVSEINSSTVTIMRNSSEIWGCTDNLKAQCGSVWKVTCANPEFGQIIATCSFDRTESSWEEASGEGQIQYSSVRVSPFKPSPTHWIKRSILVDAIYVKFAPKHTGLMLAICSTDGFVRIYEAPDVMNLTQLQHEIAVKFSAACLSWNHTYPISNSNYFFFPPMLAVGSDDPSTGGDSSNVQKVQIYELYENIRKWTKVDVIGLKLSEPVRDTVFAHNLGRTNHLVGVATKKLKILSIEPRLEDMRNPDSSIQTGGQMRFIGKLLAQSNPYNSNGTGTIMTSSGDDGKF